jgi:hypothetical protein
VLEPERTLLSSISGRSPKCRKRILLTQVATYKNEPRFLGYLASNRYQNGQFFVEKAISEPKKNDFLRHRRLGGNLG